MTDLMPHDAAAERILLGSALYEPRHLETLLAECAADDFHVPLHRRVFVVMRDRSAAKEPVSLQHVASRFEGVEVAEVASLVDGLPRIPQVGEWVRAIRERAALRQVITTARAIEERVMSGVPATEAVDAAVADLLGISRTVSGEGFVRSSDALDGAYQVLEQMAKSDHGLTGLSTGLLDLDNVVGGLRPGELILIGAETSKGKSALGVQIGEQTAAKLKHVAVFSLEMSAVQLCIRRLCSEADVSAEWLRFHRWNDPKVQDAMGRIAEAAGTLSMRRLHIDPSSRQSVAQMQARARRLQTTAGLDLVIVDYAQLVRASRKFDNRAAEIGEIAYGLLAMAQELAVPVIAMAQLNRSASKRSGDSGGRPRSSDLKESSYLEQAADVVLLIHHKRGENDPRLALEPVELIVDKNRNGSTGIAPALFNRSLARFENASTFAQDGGF